MAKTDPKAVNKRLQVALVDARKASKLTQQEVAAHLNKPQSFVSKYETGERKLTVGDYVAVCEALSLKPSRFLSDFS